MVGANAIRLRHRGATAVEFAVASLLFFGLTIGIIEFARWMYVVNAAVEATRFGARVAAVCDKNDATVRDRMRMILPSLADTNIAISYPTSACTNTLCEPVTVSIQNYSLSLLIPLAPLTVPIPSLSTSIPAESLSSASNWLCN